MMNEFTYNKGHRERKREGDHLHGAGPRKAGNAHPPYKDRMVCIVNDLVDSLESIKEISAETVSDEELKASFLNIRDTVFGGITKIRLHIESLLEDAEWDTLNLSFFGETNAGKSTIIEALVNGDGSSVGDGTKDFTKTIEALQHKGIMLIDMPGIEGREETVMNNIHAAVNKSHVIFYVCINKEPEIHTLSKMKAYLNDNARVYTILNIRGKPAAYKYVTELKTENFALVEKRVMEKFKAELEKNYAGNILVQGHLSMLTNDKLTRPEHQREQKKSIEIFGSKEKIRKFSNIAEVNIIIDRLKTGIREEVYISNSYKFIKSLKIILSRILREKKQFDIFIRESNAQIKSYLQDIEGIINKYDKESYKVIDANINRLRVELKKYINQGIEEGADEDRLAATLEKVKEKQSGVLNDKIDQLLESMTSEIERKIVEFRNRISLNRAHLYLQGEFDMDAIMEKLELNFKYVVGQIVDVSLSIWGVLSAFAINPILGIITGIIAIVRKLWDWICGDPDKRRREAKRNAGIEVDHLANDAKASIRQKLRDNFDKIEERTRQPVLQLQNSMKEIKNISFAIDHKILGIQQGYNQLTMLLMKELFGRQISFSYIDQDLSEAVVIGRLDNQVPDSALSEKLRVKKINVFSSLTEWFDTIGAVDRTGNFLVDSEFDLRAVKGFLTAFRNRAHFHRVERKIS